MTSWAGCMSLGTDFGRLNLAMAALVLAPTMIGPTNPCAFTAGRWGARWRGDRPEEMLPATFQFQGRTGSIRLAG